MRRVCRVPGLVEVRPTLEWEPRVRERGAVRRASRVPGLVEVWEPRVRLPVLLEALISYREGRVHITTRLQHYNC